MAKRKVWVESISRYIGKIFVDDVLYEVDVKINGDMNQAEIDITNKNNAGGQAWDWANGNWDEFVPKDGPDVVVWVKTPIEIPTKLRWVCITGVYADKKGAKHLPISEVGWKAGQNSSYGRSQKQKRKKATPKFKIKEDKSSTSTQRVDVGLKGGIAAKSTPGSPQKAKVKERKESFRKIPVVPSNPLDIDAIRASKIAKVMEEEGG
jgi:hypothetical protein